VLQFRRGGARAEQDALENCKVTDIGFEQQPAV
jgi:hypothetical protein